MYPSMSTVFSHIPITSDVMGYNMILKVIARSLHIMKKVLKDSSLTEEHQQ